MNTLALQVQEDLGHDPHAGDLYIFRGRRGDLVKILWSDGCCSARGLRADRHDKLLKLFDTGGQNCTPNNTPADGTAAATIQGGRERGIILHKLIEEVLTGETAETLPALVTRAETLIHAMGYPVMGDSAQGLAPAELAGCVVRALSLPEVATLRPDLTPEFPVYGSTETDTHEEATAGILDAIAFDEDGAPQVVIDWKSDVAPSPETLEHYRAQVRAHLDMSGAERGMVVCVTSGIVRCVTRDGEERAD